MLKMIIPGLESFDNALQQFVTTETLTIELEHSLASVSKWESKWEKPFLSEDKKTSEETLDYIRCMTLTPNVPEDVYLRLEDIQITLVSDYINAKSTATWFGDRENQRSPRKEIITSEVIYYWMISFQIPFSCEEWHLNRLLTLIRVCNEKNKASTTKKTRFTQAELAKRRELNEQRQRAMRERG